MKLKSTLIWVITLGVAFSACTDPVEPEPEPQEEVQEINFTFSHTANGNDIEFAGPSFQLPDQSMVKSSRISYLLSKFYLINENNEKVEFDDQYALLRPKSGYNRFTLKEVPQGNYKALGFSLGLDSAINHGNPNQYDVEHPLSPVNNSLHWNWTGGYIFIALEGMFEGTHDSYIFHIAGSMNVVNYEFPINFIKSKSALAADVEFKLEECFKNPELFDMDLDGTGTHSVTDPVTVKITKNLATAFVLNGIHE